MKYAALALLALVTGCSGCVYVPSKASLKDTALRLEFEGRILCSGTKRGPHELSTAKHCVGTKLLKVNDVPVQFIGWRQTGADSVIVSERGVTFDNWPRTGKAKQGDRVFWWGNPMGERDVYREGYVAKVFDDGIAVDATICHGDSGSGVFNDRGELVAIVSAMTDEKGCTFMLAGNEK